MPYIKKTVTMCPHCGERAFAPIRFISDDSLVMGVLDAQSREDVANRNINLGGNGIAVYYKRCRKCGFMAPFQARIVDRNGEL